MAPARPVILVIPNRDDVPGTDLHGSFGLLDLPRPARDVNARLLLCICGDTGQILPRTSGDRNLDGQCHDALPAGGTITLRMRT